jgi:putative oxidoreductase
VIPERFAPVTYALMRIVFGVLWVFHGLQKFGLFGDEPADIASLRGVAGVIEIVAGALIMVGLFTRPAAFVASGQMAFAYFIAHASRAPWPIHNGGEAAVLFCFAFLYIAARGHGWWSVDGLRRS